jgi:DNA-binding response OmpR family regulator
MAKILLVADLPWVADSVQAALSGAGHDLTVTTDPVGAAAQALAPGVELALVDLQIGSMGGMAVARAIRAAAASSGATPPAVALLLDREADAFLAGRAAVNGWIRKPFGGFALRRLIERLAAERTGAAGTARPATPAGGADTMPGDRGVAQFG